jgi:hypothetical protein
MYVVTVHTLQGAKTRSYVCWLEKTINYSINHTLNHVINQLSYHKSSINPYFGR